MEIFLEGVMGTYSSVNLSASSTPASHLPSDTDAEDAQ